MEEIFEKKKTVHNNKEEPGTGTGFVPSRYQKAIFDFVRERDGNLIVNACSGSGKTTTIIEIMKMIPPEKTVMYAAFNKDIVSSIKNKLGKGFPNISVRTIHSFGYLMLCNCLGYKTLNINMLKYSQFMNTDEFKNGIVLKNKRWKKYGKYISNVRALFNFSCVNLCCTYDDINRMVDKYMIELLGNEVDSVMKLMDYGMADLEQFDMTDMIWLPYMLEMESDDLKYDYVIVDEVQDVNIAQLDLVLKCFRDGTRGIFVGDENQMIYGFTGTDKDSFDMIKSIPNITELPLSISYRCPKKVVDFVHQYVAAIEAKEDAIDGDVLYSCKIDDCQSGDAVICRNNAPLLKAYSDLVNLGKSPHILGADFSKSLESEIRQTKQTELNKDILKEGVFSALYRDLIQLRDEIVEKYKVTKADAYRTPSFKQKYDTIQTLEILAEGLTTAEELVTKIKDVFSNKSSSDITLSTAHKSKGLEFNNVYIICDSLFEQDTPSEWEKRQERNLAYVAYTRTKNKLCFVDEKDYDGFLGGTTSVSSHMDMVSNALAVLDGKSVKNVADIKRINLKDNPSAKVVDGGSVRRKSMYSIDEIRNSVKKKSRKP